MKKTTFSLLNGQKSILLSLLMILLSLSVYTQTTYYVKENGSGNGTSWADASGDIQLLINNASAGDQIWVAKGTYYPIRLASDLTVIDPENRLNAFVLKAGVAVYGGFDGTETSLDQRDWFTNETILSGDFNNDDIISGSGATLTIDNISENAAHVVVSSSDSAEPSAVLDGFTITGGAATEQSLNYQVNGRNINGRVGGGIYCTDSSPVLKNLNVVGNSSDYLAAGIYTGVSSSNVIVSNSYVRHNNNTGTGFAYGGGVLADANAPLTLINVEIYGNKGVNGAGISVVGGTGAINITNVTVYGNDGGNRAGGIQSGGVNTVFNVYNSIIYGNTAADSPNVYVSSGTIDFTYSLVEGSGGSSNWDIPNTTDNGNNIDADPLFIDAENGDLRLAENSEAVNAGSNSLYTDAGGNLETDKDVAGNDRLIDAIIDMGAHEFGEGLSIGDYVNIGFVIYPNPVTDILNIDGVKEITSLSVFDVTGKELIRQNTNNQNVKLDVSSLSAGVYIINITSVNEVQTVKLVKK